MKCIDCVYAINERKQCYKASPEINPLQCRYFEKADRTVEKWVKEMLED